MVNNLENMTISKKIEWENFPKKKNLTTLVEVKKAATKEIDFLTDLLGDNETYNLNASNIKKIEAQKIQFLKEILNDYLRKVELIYETQCLKVNFSKENRFEKAINGEEHKETEELSDENKIATLKIFIHNLQLFEKAKLPSNNSLEETIAAVYQEKSQWIDLLTANLENELLILKEDFVELRKKLNKLSITLSCLGVKEKEMGKDIKNFFREILGTNRTGDNTTLWDIKSVEFEGINIKSLQDLIDALNDLNDEYTRQEILNGSKDNYESSTEEEVENDDDKTKRIENLPEWQALQELSEDQLRERLNNIKRASSNEEEKELISEILTLLTEELGKIATQLIITENRKIFPFLFKKLAEYEQSDRELIIKINKVYGSKLASFDNGPGTPRTPLRPKKRIRPVDEKKNQNQTISELRERLKMAENLLGKSLKSLGKAPEQTSKDKSILELLNIHEEDLQTFKNKPWKEIFTEYKVFQQKREENINQLKGIVGFLALITIISVASTLFLLIKKWYGGEKIKKVSVFDKKKKTFPL